MENQQDNEKEISWSTPLEDIIAQQGEVCRGLAWLHQHAEQLVSKKNNYIQLPVIVLSTLCGTASVGSASLFGSSSGNIPNIVIGVISISVGILNTLGNYFSYAKKSEAHRIAYLHYSKLFSQISVELSLPREERCTPKEMLKMIRDTMERLAETTPSPPEEIIVLFNQKFKDYKNISIPAECNGLAKVNVFRVEKHVETPDVRIPVKFIVPTQKSSTSNK